MPLLPVDQLASVWNKDQKEVRRFTIQQNSTSFQEFHDSMQTQIAKLSILDELLAGMRYNIT